MFFMHTYHVETQFYVIRYTIYIFISPTASVLLNNYYRVSY